MNNCCGEKRGIAAGRQVTGGATGFRAERFPDVAKLPKSRWREALAGLAGPAIRVHRYRNLRSTMLYDALSRDEDCARP